MEIQALVSLSNEHHNHCLFAYLLLFLLLLFSVEKEVTSQEENKKSSEGSTQETTKRVEYFSTLSFGFTFIFILPFPCLAGSAQ